MIKDIAKIACFLVYVWLIGMAFVGCVFVLASLIVKFPSIFLNIIVWGVVPLLAGILVMIAWEGP